MSAIDGCEKISVIVPVYKTEKYINQCVDSLLAQTYSNLEIILVDDGSPDNCPLICDEYANKDKRVRVIHKQNEGLFAAVTDGIKASAGEYIGFVDSDDWVTADMFEVLINTIVADNSDIAVCSFYKVFPARKEEWAVLLPNEAYEGEKLESCIFKKLIYERNIYGSRCNKLFRRERLINNLQWGSNCITLGEDLIRIVPVVLDAKKISVISDRFLYNYRHNSESMTNAYLPNLLQGSLTLYNELNRVLVEKNKRDLIDDVKSLHAGHIRQCLKNEIIKGGVKKEVKKNIKRIMSDELTEECCRVLKKRKDLEFKTRFANWMILKKMSGFYYFVESRRV